MSGESLKPPGPDASDIWRMFFTQGRGLIVVLNADADATVWDANPALCEATGWSKQEMWNKPWQQFVSTVDSRNVAAGIQRMIADEKGRESISGYQRWERKSATRPPLGVDVIGSRFPVEGVGTFIILVGSERIEAPLIRRDSVFGKVVDSIIVNPKPWGVALGYVVTAVVAVFAPSLFSAFVAAVKGDASP